MRSNQALWIVVREFSEKERVKSELCLVFSSRVRTKDVDSSRYVWGASVKGVQCAPVSELNQYRSICLVVLYRKKNGYLTSSSNQQNSGSNWNENS